jgi:acetyltransferase-like isoleucine patch superfamily enzyme
MRCVLRLRRIIGQVRILVLRLRGISIGKNCFISWGAKLDTCAGKITIGDGCEITYGCVLISHDASAKRIPGKRGGPGTIRLGDNVFIGVNSIVLRDVTIGDNSIIGAGSVVTKDVPPNVVVARNPAQIIRVLPER